MIAVVEPYICNNCKELTDVLVGEYGHKIKKSDLTDDKKDYYLCSNCYSENITIWNIKKRPCPKCGNNMRKGQEAILWD